MSVVNLFACIPLEILENEILSRLDLVSAVSLLIATRVTVSAAARPVIFIRWKYLAAEGAPSLTLTNTVREQLLIRAYMDIFKSTPILLNNDFAYRALEGLLRGVAVEPRTFNRIPRDTLYPVAVAVAGPRLPELMDILRIKFPEPYEKINDILLLRRGEFPREHRSDGILNDYSSRYGIPPKTYALYIAKSVAAGCVATNAQLPNILHHADSAAKYGIDISELFLAMVEVGAWLTCKWSKLPESVYSLAVTSGYLWFQAGICIPVLELSDYQWEILVADFSSRTAESQPSRVVDAMWCNGCENVLLRRIPKMTKLFTRDSIMQLAAIMDKPALYLRLRTIIGDPLFETVFFDVYRNRYSANMWIRSGGGYIERLRRTKFDRNRVDESLKVNNAEFLRGFILSGEELPPQLHVECIASGHVECVKVAREFDLPITQEDLERALTRCSNLAIVNLYI